MWRRLSRAGGQPSRPVEEVAGAWGSAVGSGTTWEQPERDPWTRMLGKSPRSPGDDH